MSTSQRCILNQHIRQLPFHRIPGFPEVKEVLPRVADLGHCTGLPHGAVCQAFNERIKSGSWGWDLGLERVGVCLGRGIGLRLGWECGWISDVLLQVDAGLTLPLRVHAKGRCRVCRGFQQASTIWGLRGSGALAFCVQEAPICPNKEVSQTRNRPAQRRASMYIPKCRQAYRSRVYTLYCRVYWARFQTISNV